MKTKYLHSIATHSFRVTVVFAAILLFTGCVFDSLEILRDKNTASDGTVLVTVGMPEAVPQTRISFEENGLDVDLV